MEILDEWICYPWDAELFKLDINAHEERSRAGTPIQPGNRTFSSMSGACMSLCTRLCTGGRSIRLGVAVVAFAQTCIVVKTMMQDGVVDVGYIMFGGNI